MNFEQKGVVFILDGLGDRPHPNLSGKTPLQAADTPYLDHLAALGQSGLMDPLFPGLSVDTHTGVSILFGLPPKEAILLSRGPIEAAGVGLELLHGDILFRANLATIEENAGRYSILDRRAGRIQKGVSTMCESLKDIEVGTNIFASLYPATQHRCVLRLRGPRLSADINDTDPGGKAIHEGVLLCEPRYPNDTAAQITANAITVFTEKAHHILKDHPVNLARVAVGKKAANGVITRGVGIFRQHKNLLSHLNLKTAVVAGESTILGLANLFNFTSVSSPKFTSLPDTDLSLKLESAKKALQTHDLVYVHIKGTDTAAHDKNPELKRDFIGAFDQALGAIDFGDTIVAVCADHSTDSRRGEHNGDAVPVLIYSKFGRRDLVRFYNEVDCVQGALSRLTAHSFIISVLDAMDKLGNFKSQNREYFGYDSQERYSQFDT